MHRSLLSARKSYALGVAHDIVLYPFVIPGCVRNLNIPSIFRGIDERTAVFLFAIRPGIGNPCHQDMYSVFAEPVALKAYGA
jgi:hypothetical protein